MLFISSSSSIWKIIDKTSTDFCKFSMLCSKWSSSQFSLRKLVNVSICEHLHLPSNSCQDMISLNGIVPVIFFEIALGIGFECCCIEIGPWVVGKTERLLVDEIGCWLVDVIDNVALLVQ